MKILVTGSAGFIGANLCNALSRSAKNTVVGVDSFDDYYDLKIKRARVDFLAPDIVHHHLNIANSDGLAKVFLHTKPDIVVHLAAQAGVRYSFEAPMKYVESNLAGQVSMLEAVRGSPSVRRIIYASSSSVYSGVDALPFVEDMDLGTPKSLYAASKIADEVLTRTYSRLFGIDAICLRFFTVYGPWGRPDMAYWTFAESILNGRPIKLFNHGDLRRDFTYIDDIIAAIVRMVDEVASAAADHPIHRVYNIGNHSPVPVREMISILERQLSKSAIVELAPLPPGDMVETFANVDRLTRDYGYSPDTPLEVGLARFVQWFHEWRSDAFTAQLSR